MAEKMREGRAVLREMWKMNESLPRSVFTFHVRRAAKATIIQARLDVAEKPAGTGRAVLLGGGERPSLPVVDERERDGTLKP